MEPRQEPALRNTEHSGAWRPELSTEQVGPSCHPLPSKGRCCAKSCLHCFRLRATTKHKGQQLKADDPERAFLVRLGGPGGGLLRRCFFSSCCCSLSSFFFRYEVMLSKVAL